MIFLIAESFFSALMKLTPREQERVLSKALELRKNPAAPNLQFHSIEKSKDAGFRSVRVDRDLRIILHVTKAAMMMCYTHHHDHAYRWAERRRIQPHPKTNAMQIVEVEEVIETRLIQPEEKLYVGEVLDEATIFGNLTDDELLSYGVPQEWLYKVKAITSEDRFLEVAERLPEEAQEALLLVLTGEKPQPIIQEDIDPLMHPDAMRRFRAVDGIEELKKALDFPWEKWAVFLHPRQRQLVDMTFNGPARVAGAAGTGKTVVAIHRVVRLLSNHPKGVIALTTVSEPLVNILKQKLDLLMGMKGIEHLKPQLHIKTIKQIAAELFHRISGVYPNVTSEDQVELLLKVASEECGLTQYSSHFLLSEWRDVIEAWRVKSLEEYKIADRSGRVLQMTDNKRSNLWPVFEKTYAELEQREQVTWAGVFNFVYDYYHQRDEKPFTHMVIDEAQDISASQLRMISGIVPFGENSLLFSGDSGQRILQRSFKWKDAGVDLRGRSHILKVNYRTSYQIHQAIEKVLPSKIEDTEGVLEDREKTISVLNGPEPVIKVFENRSEEVAYVSSAIKRFIESGTELSEIGLFVRNNRMLSIAIEMLNDIEKPYNILPDSFKKREEVISVGLMKYAKGLEFKSVLLMGCDEKLLPCMEQIEQVSDEIEQREVIRKEKYLFYVACSRARDHLTVTGLKPGSEFILDMAGDAISSSRL